MSRGTLAEGPAAFDGGVIRGFFRRRRRLREVLNLQAVVVVAPLAFLQLELPRLSGQVNAFGDGIEEVPPFEVFS